MPKELLVVDDEPKITGALKSFFEEKGFHVLTASTAQAALEQVRRNPTEVVLLDLKLPDGTGLDVLSSLKAEHPTLRVIVISSLSDQAMIHEALARGASTYLTKPFDFARCFYAAMGIETIDVSTAQADPEALAKMSGAMAESYEVLPMAWRNHVLWLAMGDPFDVHRLDELQVLLECAIHPLAATGGPVIEAIHRCYGIGAGVAEPPRCERPAPSTTEHPAVPEPRSSETSGIVQLVNALIRQAASHRATDLHLGIGLQGPWIRERVDGILYEVAVAPRFAALYSSVVSRLKVMADLDIAEHRLPHDGRIWFDAGAVKLDLRVSVLPTPRGEHVAIRLLEPTLTSRMDQLGMTPDQLGSVTTLLAKPTGLLLVAGPTGSGKSTSLYAFLDRLHTGRVNIVTIEDPIEHELPGMTQIQVQPKVGLTFAAGLRSVLRHDPDIIMVGEMRDQDTASLAVRAALTGHLVLSTLHTNDAASAITRLLDLGIEPFVLCSTLSGILSQRLVRLLCTECRACEEVPAASLISMGVAAPAPGETSRVWRAAGCPACRHTGYHGRTGAFEFLTVDHHARSLILKGASSAQIRQSSVSRGMQSLWQAGWQKAQEGLTGVDELLRVLPSELR